LIGSRRRDGLKVMRSNVRIYLDEALSQIPRILSLLDRNVNSPTYGSFYRPYWHDKATDLPCAHAQLGVLPLALVYSNNLESNIFYKNHKTLRWIIASMRFWSEIQNADGSFDEHYPNEHSFGATAWSSYAMLESYNITSNEIEEDLRDPIFEAIVRAGRFLARSDEPRVLANHQAIAAAVLCQLSRQISEKAISTGAAKKLNKVLSCQSEEGWFQEYDGADLGYLTTTISFLAKIYRQNRSQRLLHSLERAIDFASYFVYPDGSFGGTLGSRHTEHFHPHGFEIVGSRVPLAIAVADQILYGISNKKAVTPRVMDDKYFSNQVIEYIQSFLDAAPRPDTGSPLPYEKQQFVKHFRHSGMLVVNKNYYAVIATKKGCILKVFDRVARRPLLIDAGLAGLTEKGEAVATQWPDDSPKIRTDANSAHYSGTFRKIHRESLSSLKMVLTRLALLTLARHEKVAFQFKRAFIDRLITSAERTGIRYQRSISYDDEIFQVEDRIGLDGTESLKSLAIVSPFYPRYVPASEYFLPNDIISEDIALNEHLAHPTKELVLRRTIEPTGTVDVRIEFIAKEGQCRPEMRHQSAL